MTEPAEVLCFDERIQLPTSCLTVGGSNSGKSRWILQLFTMPQLFTPRPARIHIYYAQMQPIYLETRCRLEALGIEVKLILGWKVDMAKYEGLEGQSIALIDDATEETASSSECARLFMTSRHVRLSPFLIWHSLFHRSPSSRLIGLNCQLFFFLPSPRLVSQLRTLDSQLGLRGQLVEAYAMCMADTASSEHRYLCLDLNAQTPPALRLRSRLHLFPQCTYF